MAFLVTISAPTSPTPRTLSFVNSPVRIGRNQLNEIVIDEPFVSQWHALVRFQGTTMSIMDLGSTNGTIVNGQSIEQHVPARLESPEDVVEIGELKITCSFGIAPEIAIRLRSASTFEAGGGQATMMFDGVSLDDLAQKRPPMTQQSFGGPAHVPASIDAIMMATAQIRPSYDTYRHAWNEVLRQVRAQMQTLPIDQRASAAHYLQQELPLLAKEHDMHLLLKELGLDDTVMHIDPAHWLSRLRGSGGQVQAKLHVRYAMDRVGLLMETFSQSFVDLRKGYEQFSEDMGLQHGNDNTPLHDADDMRDVLDYILDWDADGHERTGQLKRVFADIALHQIAMLSGVMSGVRELLHRLSANPSTEGALAVQPVAWWNKLIPFRSATLLSQQEHKLQTMFEEDGFARVVFGRAFARAYFAITGANFDEEDENA